MQPKKTALAVTAATFIFAAIPAFLLRNAFFIREDFTYIDDVRYQMRYLSDFFSQDFCQGLWFRPIMLVFWRICWVLFGLNPGVNYAVNAGILLITAILAANIARRLGAGLSGSRLAAFLILVHPVSIATTSYLADRADILGSLAVMCALNVHFICRRKIKNQVIAGFPSALVTLAACLCKEMYATLPLLILFLPEENSAEKNAPLGISSCIKQSLPHFFALAIYVIWRAKVIGHLIGGYSHEHSSLTEVLLLFPSNAAYTISKAIKMFYGITYDPMQPFWYRFAAIAAFLSTGAWLWIGRRQLKERGVLLQAIWIVIAVFPVLNFSQLIKYSPRLLLFPVIMAILLLARLFPSEPTRRHWFAPIILLVVWLPASYLILEARNAEGEIHRKLLAAMQSYYLPGSLAAPADQYKIIFGATPQIFSMDEMFHSTLPENTEMLNSPVGTFRFLFGDRMSRVIICRKPLTKYSHRRYTDRWDYETHDQFLAFESDSIIIESWRAPDIGGLINHGNIVEVSLYDPSQGKLSDITPLFKERFKLSLETPGETISWSFARDLGGWTAGPQLQPTGPVNGSASFTDAGNDPYLARPVENMNPLPYRLVRIDMRVAKASIFGPEVMIGTVSWEGDEKPPFGLLSRVEFPVKADGQRRNYDVNVGRWPGWYLLDKIHSLRVDPADAPCRIEIFSISLIPYGK